jgi:hypothetical protein
MSLWDNFWIDLVVLALALTLLNGAVAGRFFTHGRGGPRRLICVVKSTIGRMFFFVLAPTLSAWLVLDLRRKLH